MDNQRAFAAIAISLLILLGYQYFFMPTPQPPPQEPAQVFHNQNAPKSELPKTPKAPPAQLVQSSVASVPTTGQTTLAGKDITIDTSLYHAVVSENGGVIKSFSLKKYLESLEPESPAKELINADADFFPFLFHWGNGTAMSLDQYTAEDLNVTTEAGQQKQLTMSTTQGDLAIHRTLTLTDDEYSIGLDITVVNTGSQPLQGAPSLTLANRPFNSTSGGSKFLFAGPATFLNGELLEIKTKDLEDGPKNLTGNVDWLAYEDTYFMSSIMGDPTGNSTVQMQLVEKDTVVSTLSGSLETIPAGGQKTYSYKVFMGPKELQTLKKSGHNLDKIVNFGWFDILAKPTLHLLNFLYAYLHNYGIAIILVTILFKALLWPISYKGMKSMKTMQKIQPKMAKLREKYKDNKDKLNQEMIALYKTYKVNPLGGCLPMVLQIPVFFALYKVLLQTIELRHAPFMLWITDLSAPDRLFIGIDIPVLGGIPVLTLLMGASMFLQQKMTPTAADPTQAKMMMFLPVVFTFMFLNFASGLVLYWFINNLLSIAQQYYINKSVETV